MAELKLPKLPPGVPQAFMELMEKAISFHPAIARLCGGAAPGLMCCQGMYYSRMRHVQERQGWFYKTAREWEEETCLTRREQDTAKKALRDKGFLETKLAKVNGVPTLHFKINFDAILAEFMKAKTAQTDCTDAPNPLHENAKPESTETPNGNSENAKLLDYTETPNGNGGNAKSYKEQESSFGDSQKTSKAENSGGESKSKAAPISQIYDQQSNLDAWDLRRWRDEMGKLHPPLTEAHVGSAEYFEASRPKTKEQRDQEWLEDARIAAYRAGVPLLRLHKLIKPYFPDDPKIDKLINPEPDAPLFQPKPVESEADIRETIERSLSKANGA
jgi:hypothetical protein